MTHYWQGACREGGVGLDARGAAFRLGSGFFSTLLWTGAGVCHLERHLGRLFASLEMHGAAYETVDFEQVIAEVARANGLAGRTGRVNIYYPLQEGAAVPLVAATAYEPDPDREYALEPGEGRYASPLHAHKSMSRMHLEAERTRALALGADDALLLAPDGAALETTCAAFAVGDGTRLVATRPKWRLPSTALAVASGVVEVAETDLFFDALPEYPHAYVLNALIGMKPVTRVGERIFAPDRALCAAVSTAVCA